MQPHLFRISHICDGNREIPQIFTMRNFLPFNKSLEVSPKAFENQIFTHFRIILVKKFQLVHMLWCSNKSNKIALAFYVLENILFNAFN